MLVAALAEDELGGLLRLREADQRHGDLLAHDLVVRATQLADQVAMLLEIGPGARGQTITTLDVNTQKIATRPPGNASRSTNERLVGGVPGDGDDHPLARLPRGFDAVRGEVVVQALLDTIGDPEQRKLAQSTEVADSEVVRQRGIDALRRVDVAVGHAAPERLGAHVDQLESDRPCARWRRARSRAGRCR